MDLTAQDAANLLKIIDRVDFKGNEATPVAILQQKLTALANTPTPDTDLSQPTEAPAEVVKDLEGKKK